MAAPIGIVPVSPDAQVVISQYDASKFPVIRILADLAGSILRKLLNNKRLRLLVHIFFSTCAVLEVVYLQRRDCKVLILGIL